MFRRASDEIFRKTKRITDREYGMHEQSKDFILKKGPLDLISRLILNKFQRISISL